MGLLGQRHMAVFRILSVFLSCLLFSEPFPFFFLSFEIDSHVAQVDLKLTM